MTTSNDDNSTPAIDTRLTPSEDESILESVPVISVLDTTDDDSAYTCIDEDTEDEFDEMMFVEMDAQEKK